MDFKQAVLRCVRDKYADFNGRAGRSEFWWFALACVAVGFVFSILHLDLIGMLVNLALLIPSLAVGARRLHDIGKSGWWILIGLIPLIGGLILLYFAVLPSSDGSNDYGETAQPA